MLTFEDVSPYLVNSRAYDAELLARVEAFVEHMGYRPVRTWNTAYANSGSCSGITVLLDRDQRTTLHPNTPMWLAPYKVRLLISARGPLVTSDGYEWEPTLAGEHRPPGQDRGMYRLDIAADAKAREIAVAVAEEFNLTYVDREWLRQFTLNERELTEDGLLSLDYSEPDALNVLFSESL